MPACDVCNGGTSTADLTVAIVSRWNHLPMGGDLSDHKRLTNRLRKQAPEVVNEWYLDPFEQIGPRQHLRNNGVAVPYGAGVVRMGTYTVRQLNLFANKAVLALYFEHFKAPLHSTGAVCALWRSKEDFARDGIPRELLDLFPGHAALIQGKWDERRTFEYRHNGNPDEGLFMCFARL